MHPDIYGQYAEQYDILSTDFVKTLENNFRKKLLAKFVPPRSNVIDLGCGTAASYAMLDNPKNYTGIDISKKMLNVARAKLPANCRLICHDLSKGLPQTEQGFDAVISMYGSLSHLSAAQFSRLLNDIFHALPSGGSIIIDLMNKNSLERLISGKWSCRTYHVPFLPDCYIPMEFYTPGTLKKKLEDAGFRVERITSATVLPARGLPLIRPLCNRFRALGKAVYHSESAMKDITDITGPKLGRALIAAATKP